MTENYKKIFYITILIILVVVALVRLPVDDGLRHVGVAFKGFSSWGDVYPFSVFEKFGNYNPWFGYDLSLAFIASVLKMLPISMLTLKFILTKILVLVFSLLFIYLVVERSGILNKIIDRESFTLAVIILFFLIVFSFARVIIVRPFAFGTFFILYSINRSGFIRGSFSALVLTFFYPYLSWFYIIPVFLAHFVKGNKGFAFGAISFLILFLILQPDSFWGFQIALFMSDLVRNTIDVKISEFNLTPLDLRFYIYTIVFAIFYPKFSKESNGLNYLSILILIYLFPAVKYIRYFLDILLPLFFVAYGNEIFNILVEPYRRIASFWEKTVPKRFSELKLAINLKLATNRRIYSSRKSNARLNLKVYIFVSYVLLFFLSIYINTNQFAAIKKYKDFLKPIPENSLILTSFNLQYKTLFVRPDLRLIPSCEIGFAKENISREYSKFFNTGIIIPLSIKSGAKFFIENKDFYIDPYQGKNLKLRKRDGNLKLWEISSSGKLFHETNKL